MIWKNGYYGLKSFNTLNSTTQTKSVVRDDSELRQLFSNQSVEIENLVIIYMSISALMIFFLAIKVLSKAKKGILNFIHRFYYLTSIPMISVYILMVI